MDDGMEPHDQAAGTRAGPLAVPAAGARVLSEAFAAQRPLIWGVCYRMLGTAADADDLVQETFARALAHPPLDLERELRPWLLRVALNLARDQLRRRKLERYSSSWLPGPIETGLDDPRFEGSESPEARYGRLESVSFAFLRALEVLTPAQRAVLILRDVLDLSVRETAELLELGEPNVKTTHHRARALMADYEALRRPPTRATQRAHQAALRAFLVHFAANNIDALKRLLSAEVVAYNDADPDQLAARRAVTGFESVLMFSRKTANVVQRLAVCTLNGCPALLLELGERRTSSSGRVLGEPDPRLGDARRKYLPRYAALWVELDAADRIAQINVSVARTKLAGLPWERLRLVTPRLIGASLWAALTTPSPRVWFVPASRRLLGALRDRLAGARFKRHREGAAPRTRDATGDDGKGA